MAGHGQRPRSAPRTGLHAGSDSWWAPGTIRCRRWRGSERWSLRNEARFLGPSESGRVVDRFGEPSGTATHGTVTAAIGLILRLIIRWTLFHRGLLHFVTTAWHHRVGRYRSERLGIVRARAAHRWPERIAQHEQCRQEAGLDKACVWHTGETRYGLGATTCPVNILFGSDSPGLRQTRRTDPDRSGYPEPNPDAPGRFRSGRPPGSGETVA